MNPPRTLRAPLLAVAVTLLFPSTAHADVIFDSFGPNGEFVPFVQWVVENETCFSNLSDQAAYFTTTETYTNLAVTVPLAREDYSCATGVFEASPLVFRLHRADETDVELAAGATNNGPGTVLATTVMDTGDIPFQPVPEETFTVLFDDVTIGPGEYYVSLHLEEVDATNILWPISPDLALTEGGAIYPTTGDKWYVYFAFNPGAFPAGAMRVEGDLGAWSDQGFGLDGAAGPPLLVASGDMSAGSTNTVVLSDAAQLATAALFLATSSDPVPFKGGLLAPHPFLPPVVVSTDGLGGIAQSFVMPAGIPPGVELWVQWAIQDAGAVAGVALSNAVRGLTP